MSDSRPEETGMALVASILTGIQKSQLETERRMGSMEGKLAEIHSEVKRTNGRVTEIETWRDGWQDESDQAAAYSAGVEKRKSEERRVAGSIWRSVKPYALIAGTAVMAGAGAHVAAFFLGASWW